MRETVSSAVGANVPVSGSKISAVLEEVPPAISTRPSASGEATAAERAAVIGPSPALENVPVAGS